MITREQGRKLEALARKHGERYAFDLAIPCPHKQCGADIGEPCRTNLPKVRTLRGRGAPLVHFGRRVKSLLAGLK